MGDLNVNFSIFKKQIMLKSHNKIKPHNLKEKQSRNLWCTIFTPACNSPSVLAAQMCTNHLQYKIFLCTFLIKMVIFVQDQLLSVSQDKTARLTNISSCAEIQRYHCESEIWSCAWNLDDPNVFFVGTKRQQESKGFNPQTSGNPK